MMQRRDLIASLALGTVMTPRAGRSQTARKVYHIGIMGLRPTSDLVGPKPHSPSTRAFLEGMRNLGYVYGEHFVTEPRGADGRPERLSALAAELVDLRVDVIVAAGPALAALKQMTNTIPIVMAAVYDPVTSGFVKSLARPGGNFTGLSFGGRDLHAKRLELLKEIVPDESSVGVVWEGEAGSWQTTETAARSRDGSCCRSRSMALMESTRPSGRPPRRESAAYSCLPRPPSSSMPNRLRGWRQSIGFPPSMSCGDS